MPVLKHADLYWLHLEHQVLACLITDQAFADGTVGLELEFVAVMDTHCWNRPVSLEMYGHGNYRVVSSPKDAVRVLCEEWPVRGRAQEVALTHCFASLRGKADIDAAREAFIAAANEARIKIVN
jgi:hypothetical protein